MRRYVLTITCPDRVGLVAAVTSYLASRGGWVTEAAQHADPETGRFFQRIEVLADSLDCDADALREGFEPLVREFDLDLRLSDTDHRKRLVLLASKEDHCLVDILHRSERGELACEIPLVIANHPDLAPVAERYGVPFALVSFTPEGREAAMSEITARIAEVGGEVVVLARYMQILSPELCEQYPDRILNIHHSALPSFAGPRPYHQAFERGVKLIGATCHYVTAELDGGPIIAQDTAPVGHAESVEDLIRIGRDIERTVLARGLRWHLEDRVLVNGSKTVVFA